MAYRGNQPRKGSQGLCKGLPELKTPADNFGMMNLILQISRIHADIDMMTFVVVSDNEEHLLFSAATCGIIMILPFMYVHLYSEYCHVSLSRRFHTAIQTCVFNVNRT